MRHEVNLAAHLQIKTSPTLFEQANKATNGHIKRVPQILAKRGKTRIDDPAVEVNALCKQVVAFIAQTIGSSYNAINYRRQMFAGWAHFGAPCVFFTTKPLESRSPFCWKLCNANFSLQHFPNPGESKLLMPNYFQMINQIIASKSCCTSYIFLELF